MRQMIGVMALMRAAANWRHFHRALQRSYPKLNETIPMDLGHITPSCIPQASLLTGIITPNGGGAAAAQCLC